MGIFQIIVGFVWFFIGEHFHTRESYLDRFVIYILFTIAYGTGLTFYWPYVSKAVFGAIIKEHSLDQKQEMLLYVVMNIVYATLIALMFPIPSSLKLGKLCSGGIADSVGFWFVNAVIGLLVGLVFTLKSGTALPESLATPISSDSTYDGIN